ncbi:unnamed protein product [Rotaria socialis]|uniref:Alpha-1,6-mannosyl-glycoprotein 2-beta-N-acetylglucosaminyltransferase n=2 Tax=Rotaria socialis TaxID=392032 RepID=A0A820QXZ2_9BILA|nr:unnamed protein product [Rotaria socialis]CAF3271137.1 unnamed protein product [Rotaria socialis]CAF3618554.1 unnamed protein product [Rotaria socialis]CAF4349718.1 unnamed protein product [Rotaria socialis]CAF4429923.1 unnamed protein product [Rotaria socialis]
MYHCLRYRCAVSRSIIFWIIIITMFKIASIFYYDLQHRTIDSSSSSLLFDIKEKTKKFSNISLSSAKNEIESLNSTIANNLTTIEYYREYVKRKNHEQFMYNSNLFLSKTTRYILLVQVHTRVVYFKKFIEMLQVVETINESLVIFSHDFIDSNINSLITSITFVPVIQIFYPFSQQLYPSEFPGLDPNDCPRDIVRHKALASRCNNAPNPDRYGHYREVSIVQIKHHWWWKLNFVFNSIEILQNRTDYLLLLLEEDFYLSPDALVFLKKMETTKELLCPECLFYTLGNLEKAGRQFGKLSSKISIAYWHARYNLGMTISHSLWTLLVKYAEEFCTIDDYNWDWSLVYLAQQRFQFPRVMYSSATRVIHLGSCGTHHKKFCSSESDIARWTETDKLYRDNRKYLFPETSLSVHLKYEGKRIFKQPNGGWSDIRDRQLCLSFAFKDYKNITPIDAKI